MSMKYTELRCREVICIADGRRLGYISDIRLKIPEGEILSIIVPGKCRFLGLFGRKDDYVIPWNCIRRIGPDIILVEVNPMECCVPRGNFSFL